MNLLVCCLLTSILKDNKQELEFVKEHGSNNQLFLTLRKQITIIQKTDKKIHDMSSAIKVKQTHKIYDYQRDKLYSIQHHVDYRNDQSARLCVFHNRKLLKQKKSLIIKQISAAKSKVLKYLDEIEERLIIEVESVQEKNEEKIYKERSMAIRETSSTAYNIMLTTEMINLHVCVYFTVYFVFF
jgi:hypothetical protein